MASRDPNHIYRQNMWSSYGISSHHASTGRIAAPGDRDPNHIYRKGFWDTYQIRGKATGSGSGSGSGGSGSKKKAKAKGHHTRWSRHMIAAAALHDAWGHKGQAGGQG